MCSLVSHDNAKIYVGYCEALQCTRNLISDPLPLLVLDIHEVCAGVVSAWVIGGTIVLIKSRGKAECFNSTR